MAAAGAVRRADREREEKNRARVSVAAGPEVFVHPRSQEGRWIVIDGHNCVGLNMAQAGWGFPGPGPGCGLGARGRLRVDRP